MKISLDSGADKETARSNLIYVQNVKAEWEATLARCVKDQKLADVCPISS